MITLAAAIALSGTQALDIVKTALRDLGVPGKPRLQKLTTFDVPNGGKKVWSITFRLPSGDYEGYLDDATGKIGTLQLAGSGSGSIGAPTSRPTSELTKKLWSVVKRFSGKQDLEIVRLHQQRGFCAAHFPILVNRLHFLNGAMLHMVSIKAKDGSFVAFRSAPEVPPVPSSKPKITFAQAEKLIEKIQAATPPPKVDRNRLDISKRQLQMPGKPHHGLELGHMFDDHNIVHLVWRGYLTFPDPLNAKKTICGTRIVIDAHTGSQLTSVPY